MRGSKGAEAPVYAVDVAVEAADRQGLLRGLDGPAQGVCQVPCTPELLTLLDALEAML